MSIRDDLPDCACSVVVRVNASTPPIRFILFRRRDRLELLLDGQELGLRLGDNLSLRCRRCEEAALLCTGAVEEPRDTTELGADAVAASGQPALEAHETTRVGTVSGGATRPQIDRTLFGLDLERLHVDEK